MWALITRFQSLELSCLDVKVKLFKTLVSAVGMYACQVWGVEFLRFDSEAHVSSNPFQALVLSYLRIIGGVCWRSLDCIPSNVTWRSCVLGYGTGATQS